MFRHCLLHEMLVVWWLRYFWVGVNVQKCGRITLGGGGGGGGVWLQSDNSVPDMRVTSHWSIHWRQVLLYRATVGGGGIPPPLNSPITKINLVNSPITKNSELFHRPLSHVTMISCITIHHLENASSTNHQELK